jgi:hypothetical protein
MGNKFREKHPIIYAVAWPFAAAAYIPFGIARVLFYRRPKKPPNWWKDWENFVDDPIDKAKEFLHCHDLPFGLQLNISIIMKNREPKTWDIVRKRGAYANCDPEDLQKLQGEDQNR